MKLRYPIGQQDFQSIREEGKVYIDKTDLIFQLVNDYKYVFLSRPRRFGKSLLLSTIKAYFQGKRNLFEGLAVQQLEKKWIEHPVFHLELSRVNPGFHESLKNLLNQQFSIWEEEIGIKNTNEDFGSRFSTILIESYRKHGRKAVILVDEYDNPLINTLSDNKDQVHDLNRELLKSVYSNLKDLDSYICFGMLTGVSRFSKMSVFSGLNNLKDISFNNKYSSICGITENEIKKFLHQGVINLSEEQAISREKAYEELAKWYDGYHFSEKCPDLYNPFSLLNALDSEAFYPYWFETATPEFLVKKLKDSELSLNELFHDEVEQTDLAASDTSFTSPLSLLYQTGYLTIKGYDKNKSKYLLGIPNREVRDGFLPFLLSQYLGKDKRNSNKEAHYIKDSLLKGNTEIFIKQLKIYLGSIPYTIIPKITEKYFQNTLFLLFSVMGLEVEAETPTSFGRSDLIVKTDRFIYIFELKLDTSAEKALQQIEEMQYYLPFANDVRRIIKIGLNFSSKTRSLASWVIKKAID